MEKDMKLKQLNKASVKNIDNRLFLELPDRVIKDLSISDSDHFIVTIRKETMILHKSLEIDIPEVIYSELSGLFKGNDEIISKWLQTPKAFLVNEAPIDMLNTERGIASILDLIHRIQTGDLS